MTFIFEWILFIAATIQAGAADGWIIRPASSYETVRIKAEAERSWLAEDGTMILNPGEDRPPFHGFRERTAGNDNGILFAVEYYWLLRSHGLLTGMEAEQFKATVRALQVRDEQGQPIKGLYHRNPGRSDRLEAHDNFVAIVSGSALFGVGFAQDIVEFGRHHEYVYNNLEPDNVGWRAITQWRQGGEIAYYKLVAGEAPGMRDFLWLWLSFLEGSFSSVDNASGNLLEWLRIKAIEEVMHKPEPKALKPYFRALKPVIWFWKESLFWRTKGEGMHWYFNQYFGGRTPQHPLVPLSRGIAY